MNERLRRVRLGLLVAILATAAGCAADAGDDDDMTEEDEDENLGVTSEALTANEMEGRIIRAINDVRRSRSLPAVSGGACVDGFAERWAGRLVSTGTFRHQDIGPINRRCNGSWAGEVLAGGAASITAKGWVDAWMASPSHRAILLTRRADRVGVAVRTRPNGDRVIVADFIDRPNE